MWIPCNERLPENDDVVLITTDMPTYHYGELRYIEFGAYSRGQWWWLYESGKDFWMDLESDGRNVIAWMPVPKPYQMGRLQAQIINKGRPVNRIEYDGECILDMDVNNGWSITDVEYGSDHPIDEIIVKLRKKKSRREE